MIVIRSDLWKSGAFLAAILPKNKCDMISVLPQQVKAGTFQKRLRNWMKFTISDGKRFYCHVLNRASLTWSEQRTIPVSPETGQERPLCSYGNGSGTAGRLLLENILRVGTSQPLYSEKVASLSASDAVPTVCLTGTNKA